MITMCLNLVQTIIQLAHNKKVQVIAEGIESKDQFELLKEMKCDAIQGYYLVMVLGLIIKEFTWNLSYIIRRRREKL